MAHHFAGKELPEIRERRFRDGAGQQKFPDLTQAPGDVAAGRSCSASCRDIALTTNRVPNMAADEELGDHFGVDILAQVSLADRPPGLGGDLRRQFA